MKKMKKIFFLVSLVAVSASFFSFPNTSNAEGYKYYRWKCSRGCVSREHSSLTTANSDAAAHRRVTGHTSTWIATYYL